MRTLFLSIMVMLCTATVTAGERLKAERYKEQVMPDLLKTNWPEPEHFFRKERVAVGIAVGEQWLLVSVRSGDADRIEQIQAYGMQLWIDPSGKHKPHFGLYFPMGHQVAATTQAPSLEEVLQSERSGVEVEKGFVGLQKGGEDQFVRIEAQQLGFPVSDQVKDGVWSYRVAIPLGPETGLKLPKKGKFALKLRTPEPDEVLELSIKGRAEREQRGANRRGAFGNEMRGGQFSRGLDGSVFHALKALSLELEVKYK